MMKIVSQEGLTLSGKDHVYYPYLTLFEPALVRILYKIIFHFFIEHFFM